MSIPPFPAVPTPTHSFPETRTQWISDQLEAGADGLQDANRYLMESYLRPLIVYCNALGLSKGVALESDELVHGFFADRLADPKYLSSWLASGMRMRKWLRNGLHFYAHERRREKDRSVNGTEFPDDLPQETGAPEMQFEREWARAALHIAMTQTIALLERRGRRHEWDLFLSHYVDGTSYAALGGRFNLTAAQVAQRAFAVGSELRSALVAILRRDGAVAGEVDTEIRSMMEAMHDLGP